MKARRREFCRTCRRETAQSFMHADAVTARNGDERHAEHYRCLTCGLVVLTLADVNDAENIARQVLVDYLRRTPAWTPTQDEQDELALLLYGEVWAAFLGWQPELCLRFRAYAVQKCRNRLADERRGWIGGSSGASTWLPKPLAVAVSLDGPASNGNGNGDGRRLMDTTVGTVAVDSDEHSLADFRRAVASRRGEIAEEDRRVGRTSKARAAP